MNKIKLHIKKYNKEFLKSANIDSLTEKKIIELYNLILKIKKNKKKLIIAGNGGSAAIASHFSVDITKNAKVRCVNFNESDLITCFANDYGYENWVKRALEFYSDRGDLVILISSSGNSLNMINAAKFCRKKRNKLITFTGFDTKNNLKKLGDVNFWINSKNYNIIENSHQYWLLTLVDLITKK